MHIDPNLYQGRPADCTGRLDREIACYDLLDALGISYTRSDHDAAGTIADCHAIEGLLEAAICKKSRPMQSARRRTSICSSWRGTSPSARRICPSRSAPPVCPLQRRRTWSSTWA
ncbi:MAG: hypothetical protein ACLUNZ_14255 [Evtepia sp.]